jgi:hypothetical protein
LPVMGALKKEKEIHKMRRYKRMTRRRLWLFAPLGLVILGLVCSDASAWEKRRSGKYKGRRSSGTFQQKVYRERGTVTRDTKWQNERGEGSRRSERVWDREEGTGAYSSSRQDPMVEPPQEPEPLPAVKTAASDRREPLPGPQER